MNTTTAIALVTGGFQRHVTVGALLRFWRVIERSCTLAGNAAGLPVVVLIESAEPAVSIDRHIKMNLVAGRAEFRGLIAHERLEEHAAVRFGIQADQKIVQSP